MEWRSHRILAFDTETTGFNPEQGDRVIEFAAVEFRLRPEVAEPEIRYHHHLFNPGIPIPEESTATHGIRDADVADQPPFERHAAAIHGLFAGAITVAHNYPFDQRFLVHEFARSSLAWPESLAEVDTLDLSRARFSDARFHNLGELSKRLEVSLVGAHRATNDAEACGRCFLAMTRRFDAPDSLDGLVAWADAVAPAPEGPWSRGADGVLRFTEGPSAGEPVEGHPETLAWMALARERADGSWRWAWPEAVRRWAERWLRARASGRASQGSKGFGPADWGIDPPLGAGRP
jgi:DNA polymerase III epsilon subunit-like protein